MDAKGFLADPFASEKPLFTITAANLDQYKDKLSDGQVAMFKLPRDLQDPGLPDPPHRRGTRRGQRGGEESAVTVQPINDGNGLANFADSRYYAFPIPKNGVEVIWNHITRYRGGNLRRIITQATPQVNGSYTPIRFEEEWPCPRRCRTCRQARARTCCCSSSSR